MIAQNANFDLILHVSCFNRALYTAKVPCYITRRVQSITTDIRKLFDKSITINKFLIKRYRFYQSIDRNRYSQLILVFNGINFITVEDHAFFTPVRYNKTASSEAALEKDLCSASAQPYHFIFFAFH